MSIHLIPLNISGENIKQFARKKMGVFPVRIGGKTMNTGQSRSVGNKS
jgi:hypothetical protein